jgi:hypothetical protein
LTGPLAVEFHPVRDFAPVAHAWLTLEARGECSFFQSWAWTGCLVEERFPDPWLLSARRGDRIVALGLFNRGPRPGLAAGQKLALGESGDPRRDSIFIEHNGLLLDCAETPELAMHCWAALAATETGRSGWTLSGVRHTELAVLPADRAVRITARRPAPFVDFAALPPGIPFLEAGLSANARQQLRRALRAWDESGPLTLEFASTAADADRFLSALKSLHQSYWTGRGKPGAFAEPFFERFHRTLLGRAGTGQSVDLIRVCAGSRELGYLYNFTHRGWTVAYQSGFDFCPQADRLKPGLVCHLQAIEHYRQAGMRLYDFLGGAARYKSSFANAEIELLWLEARPRSLWPFRWPPANHRPVRS